LPDWIQHNSVTLNLKTVHVVLVKPDVIKKKIIETGNIEI